MDQSRHRRIARKRGRRVGCRRRGRHRRGQGRVPGMAACAATGAGQDATCHRRGLAQERRRARHDRRRRLRQSLRRDGARCPCRSGAARFLRRSGHRDEGRVNSDGSRRREFLSARAVRGDRPHHSVQSSLHVRRRQIGGAARRRQYHRGQATRAGAAFLAASGRIDRRHPATGRLESGAGRQGSRPGAGQPPGRCQGRPDRKRADRPRGDESRRGHAQAGDPRARRQERADRLPRCRSRRRFRRPSSTA